MNNPYDIHYGKDGKQLRYDIKGNVIDRPIEDYPYSFSDHTTWVCSAAQKKKAEALTDSSTIYSDRLYSGGPDRYNQACRDVWNNQGQCFESRNPKDIEKFLRHYYEDQSIILTQIVKSCNQSNGFPCWCFFFSINK